MNPEQDNDPRALAQRRLEAMVGRGELSLAEFSDRAAKIWAATCPAELDVALSGLPAGEPGPATHADSAPARYPQSRPPATRPGSAITVDESQKKRTATLTTQQECAGS